MHAFLSAPKFRHLVLAMGLAGLSSLAHAAVVAQATASVSNFGFAVKDLVPDDGIAPSFTVNHPWSYDASASVLKYQETSSGGLVTLEFGHDYDRRKGSESVNIFNPKPLTAALASGDGRVEIAQGAVSAAVTLKSDDFIGAEYGWYRYGNWLNNYAGGIVVGAPQIKADVSAGYERWMLAPGSEVTVSGTITLQASVDAAALGSLTPGDEVLVAAMATAQPIFYSNYGFWDNVEIIENLPGDTSYVVLKAQEHASDALGSLGREHANSLLEQSFSYTIRNHRSEAVDMYFGLSVMARAGAAPVPEPSTWALMLVGLSSMGAASAWRRRIGSK